MILKDHYLLSSSFSLNADQRSKVNPKTYPIGGEEGEDENAKEDMEDKEWSCKSYGGHMCLVRPFCQRRET